MHTKWYAQIIVSLVLFSAVAATDILQSDLEGTHFVGESDGSEEKRLWFSEGKYGVDGMGGMLDGGAYALVKGKLRLTSSSKGPDGKPHIYQCAWKTTSKSFLYARELYCGALGSFFPENSKRAAGDTVMIDGAKAVLMNGEMAGLTTKAVFRKKPNKKGAPIRCSDGSSPLVRDFKVLARTESKVKVDKWENYWYYIQVPFDELATSGCFAPPGWVFGEFVRFR